MARLRVECQGRAQDMPIVGTTVTLGRGDENTIVLDDKQASRVHCQIERFEGGWKVVDLESRNGTKVNGGFVNQHLLRNGDRIEVGAVVVTFLTSADEGTDPSLSPPPPGVRKSAKPTPAGMPAPVRATSTVPRPMIRRSSSSSLGTTLVVVGVLFVVGFFAVNALKGEGADVRRARLAYEEGAKFESQGKYKEALDSYKTIEPRQTDYFDAAQGKITELEKVLEGLKRQQMAEQETARLKEVRNYAAANKDKPDEVAKRVALFSREFPASRAIPELNALVESLKKGSGGGTGEQTPAAGDSFRSIETVATQCLASRKYGEALKVLNQFIKENPTSKDAGRATEMAKDALTEAEVFFEEKAEQAKVAVQARRWATAREAYQAVLASFADEKTSLFELVLKAKNELKRIDELEGMEKK